MTHRILIVEDDAAIRALLADVLSDAGYTPITTPTADAALQMFASVRPHLILCDLVLPGMDGVTFYERLLRLPEPPPVIFLTALGALDLEARLRRQAPACPVLVKPIDIRRLVATVATVLDPTP